MQTIIIKIVSLILSFVFSIMGLFPGLSDKIIREVEDVQIIHNDGNRTFPVGSETTRVIHTYKQWIEVVHNEMEEDASVITAKESLFKDHNVVIIQVAVPNPSYEIEIKSVRENGINLEIEYYCLEKEHDTVVQVEEYYTIFVTTSNYIFNVNLNEGETIHLPQTRVVKNEFDSATLNGETRIITNYNQWEEFKSNELKDRVFENYTDHIKEYSFDKNNLVVIDVKLPDPTYKVVVESVVENDSLLEVKYYCEQYNLSNDEKNKYDTIFIKTSKNISNVNIIKGENINLPNDDPVDNPIEMQEFMGYNYFICDSENFDCYNKVIKSYDELQKCFEGNVPGFDKYNEEYFENNSLAVAILYLIDDGKDIRLSNIEEQEIKVYNSKKELIRTDNYLFVTGWVENANTNYNEGMVNIIIEVDKDVDEISFKELGFGDEGAVYDYNMFDNLQLTDNKTMIVSSYEAFTSIVASEYYTEYFEYEGICEEFFDEKNLALGVVMIQNDGYIIDITSINNNNNILEIGYDVIDKYETESELVEYKVIVAETSKNTESVKLNCDNNRIKHERYYASNFNLIDKSPVLVSDYSTWQSLVSSTSSVFTNYDETYFKNNSIVLIPETFTGGTVETEMIKVHENGDTLEIVYGLNHLYDFGHTAITQQVILIEVPGKNIKNITVEKKNKSMSNFYQTSGNYKLMVDEPTIISEYEVWASMVDTTNEKYSMYNEEYFEENSIVLFTAMLPDTGGETIIKYAYEEGNTLEVGYTSYSVGGFTVITYEAVLITVSKNITQVNITELR